MKASEEPQIVKIRYCEWCDRADEMGYQFEGRIDRAVCQSCKMGAIKIAEVIIKETA